MSDNASVAICPSHSSQSDSPAPASESSPLPSSEHQFPLSGQHAASPSEAYLSPLSAHHHPSTPSSLLHPTTNSVAEYIPGAPPFLNSQPPYGMQPSTSTLQLKHSMYSYSFPPPPEHLAQLPFPQDPYHRLSAMNISYPIPIPSLQNSQLLQPVQPFVTIRQPGDLINENCSVHPPHGQVSNQTYYGNGMFKNSHNFTVSNSTFIDNSITVDNFMKEFLQHTIIGAEYDSSARHPPPRCHPGTRLAIIERCKNFIVQCDGKEKTRWVVGPAGVGKSAIMQMVAEEIPADASVFLSVNGRQDGTKTFTTIAYQLAAKFEPYRQFIQNETNRDPSLLQKSLPVQFQKFIVDPFVRKPLFDASHRFLITIDGLDECDSPLTQLELLELISEICIKYPASPIVWLIASRPEPHITSFFDDDSVAPSYTKEEIEIDSDEACEDVQRYLRNKLNKIKTAYPALKHKREWPSELELTKIATAAGGLFAYAATVVRYIGDPHYRNPAAQLRHVLEAIHAGPDGDGSGRDHPMAQLDALYQRILSNIPADVMIDTRKLLLIYSDYGWPRENFRWQCNRLGLSEDTVYGAVCHLHAVLKVPTPDEADNEDLEYFHKSFADFILNFKRSGFFRNVMNDFDQLQVRTSFRIIKEVPDDLDSTSSEEGIRCFDSGYLRDGPGFCDNISLSWPGDERYQTTDDELKLKLYRDTISDMCHQFGPSSKFYRSMGAFYILTTRFTALASGFPFDRIRDSVFDQFRPRLTDLGKLTQVPVRTLDYAAICGRVDFRFMSPIGVLTDPWNPSCNHVKKEKEDVEGLQQRRGWTTDFERSLNDSGDDAAPTDIPRFSIKAGKDSHWKAISGAGDSECLYCLRRLAYHFINNPSQLATVFVDSTEMCYVELSFVDPDDGVSEWRSRFFHSGPPSCIN